MASELKQRMAFEEETKNLIGIPECLVHMERRMVLHGPCCVENPYDISVELTGYVHSKAYSLVVYLKEECYVLKRHGYGQCGFIQKDKIHTSPSGTKDFSVVPVTAKHNLRRCINNGKVFHAVQAQVLIGDRCSADFASNDLDWIPSFLDAVPLCSEAGKDNDRSFRTPNWKFDVDILIGNPMTCPTQGITSEHCSLTLVRDNFQLEVGQKVGMAMLFPPQTKPTAKSVASYGVSQVAICDMELESIIWRAKLCQHLYR